MVAGILILGEKRGTVPNRLFLELRPLNPIFQFLNI